MVAPPTGPPRLIAGLRCLVPAVLLVDGVFDSLGERGSGNSVNDSDRRRLIRSLTAGSLWNRTKM
jgi:hypothetical protein